MINTVFFPGLGLEFELNRVAFSLFGHNIYWYGVIIACGFLLAVGYGLWRAPRFSMDPDVITDAIFVVVPSAIVGARAYYVIFNPSVCYTAEGAFSLYRMVAFWDGGLAIYGGIIATVISALIFCAVRKVDFWSGMDITSYGLLIGQMIGRWGNFINVEAYGSLTTLPWRMCSESIANDLWRQGLLDSQQTYESILDGSLGVHPTFLYESLWNLMGFILLVLVMRLWGRKFNGQIFLSYVVWYGLGRSVIEGLRTDSLYFFGTGIRSSQMLGIVSVVAGIILYVVRMNTAGPASPPFVPASARNRDQRAGAAAEAVGNTVQEEEAGTSTPCVPSKPREIEIVDVNLRPLSAEELESAPKEMHPGGGSTDDGGQDIKDIQSGFHRGSESGRGIESRPEDEHREEKQYGGNAD